MESVQSFTIKVILKINDLGLSWPVCGCGFGLSLQPGGGLYKAAGPCHVAIVGLVLLVCQKESLFP